MYVRVYKHLFHPKFYLPISSNLSEYAGFGNMEFVGHILQGFTRLLCRCP